MDRTEWQDSTYLGPESYSICPANALAVMR